VGSVASAADAERLLVRGGAIAAVVIPAGWEQDLRRGREASVQVLLDGADNNSAVQARAKIEAAVRAIGLSIAAGDAARGAPPLEVRTFTRFNPEGRSAVFLVPGITALLLATVAVLLTALTVSREWERG